MVHSTASCLQRLIERLDADSSLPSVEAICAAVKRTLIEEIVDGNLRLPDDATEAAPDRYARHLLHRADDGRYSVVAMVWGRGQGTPIHDHAGKWCVECVYDGKIRVISYELLGDASGDRVRFHEETRVMAGKGEAGALIPPFDYHVIENPDPVPAVTIHVYGGDMEGFHAFTPIEGSDEYAKEWCQTGCSS